MILILSKASIVTISSLLDHTNANERPFVQLPEGILRQHRQSTNRRSSDKDAVLQTKPMAGDEVGIRLTRSSCAHLLSPFHHIPWMNYQEQYDVLHCRLQEPVIVVLGTDLSTTFHITRSTYTPPGRQMFLQLIARYARISSAGFG